MKHQWENLSFQQYGFDLFGYLAHGDLIETIQKTRSYIEKVKYILEHVGENIFVRKTRNQINDRLAKILDFTLFAMERHEKREKLAIPESNSYREYMSYLFKDLWLRMDILQLSSLIIYKLCRFHSEFCDILNQIEGKSLIPQEIPE